ncbi:hypothetical protein FB45DRAFT_1076282 [Roridomyces roridus]|uniref:F-box domain-containing protein n=1 Tax=Roridomyces roridus TaxID=1738132 RepID=A0AAD7CIL9_9AGAR|nr:hypothetical protein FB45DRAFT_1076282 [Roridomyces roridus]
MSVLGLPVEVVQSIMLQSLAEKSRPMTTESPLILTQICSLWREISLQSPELWQSISLDDDEHSPSPEILDAWAIRAADRPLNISLHAIHDPETYLQWSMLHSTRWQNIDLKLPASAFSILTHQNGPFPMLRSFSLAVAFHGGRNRCSIPIRDAPLLVLKITSFDAGETISFLQHCSNLVDLTFTLQVPSYDEAPSHVCTLPSLRSLMNAGSAILPYLTAPNLTRLDLWGPAFRLLLDTPPHISAPQFRAFLILIPTVTDIQFAIYTAEQQQLVSVLRSTDILPHLETLRIDRPAWGEGYDVLFETVRERRESSEARGRLATLHLCFPHIQPYPSGPTKLPNVTKDRLLALQSADFRVTVVD